MVFSSAAFLFAFLPAVLLLAYPLPRRAQNYALLLASVLFYIWGAGSYIWVIGSVSVGSWLLAKIVYKHRQDRLDSVSMWLAVLLVSLPLLFYKYAPVVASLFDSHGFTGSLFLPLGISFFTFHAISYVVDVARGTIEPEKNLANYLLYLFLFPHQIAGPIVRFREISDEIAGRLRARTQDVVYGLARFGWGLAKKAAIADNAGLVADAIWTNLWALNTPAAWLGVLAYAVQIYFDFSAYSDMAIGIARVFNFHFPENFAGPYRSRSATEFWSRWHMTLSRWFRDYVYIPFGGNRHGRLREYAGLLLTFALTSLWHGAFTHFLLWGAMWSGLLLIERITGLRKSERFALVRRLWMVFFILLSWVPFRSSSLDDVWNIYTTLFSGENGALNPKILAVLTPITISALLVGAISFMLPGRLVKTRLVDTLILRADGTTRVTVAAAVVVTGIVIGAGFAIYASFSPFLYYQF